MGFHQFCGNDNWTFAFEGRPEVRTCSACGGVLAKEKEALPGVKVRRRKFDISFTYDGACIVTEKFKAVCESHRFTGTVFRPLPDDPGFYVLWSDRTVEFDPAGGKNTSFGFICSMGFACFHNKG